MEVARFSSDFKLVQPGSYLANDRMSWDKGGSNWERN